MRSGAIRETGEMNLSDQIATSELVIRRLSDDALIVIGVIAILFIVALNVANARARARMTPEERAEHDEEVSRFEQEW
jgi:hypothetical protein